MLSGYGGENLLPSYEVEMKPILVRRLQQAQKHIHFFGQGAQIVITQPDLMVADSESGVEYRQKLADKINSYGSLHADHGIELDSRFKSAVIFQDLDGAEEPKFDNRSYTPSTWPGSRAPHVFLQDGRTSTLDVYGPGYTLFDFTTSADNSTPSAGDIFGVVSQQLNIPVKIAKLRQEKHVRRIFGRSLVLIRQDGHVAWRSGKETPTEERVKEILQVVTGQTAFPGYNIDSSVPDDSEVNDIAMGATGELFGSKADI
jgi:hypothetical protein